jgi:hypothetical protein
MHRQGGRKHRLDAQHVGEQGLGRPRALQLALVGKDVGIDAGRAGIFKTPQVGFMVVGADFRGQDGSRIGGRPLFEFIPLQLEVRGSFGGNARGNGACLQPAGIDSLPADFDDRKALEALPVVGGQCAFDDLGQPSGSTGSASRRTALVGVRVRAILGIGALAPMHVVGQRGW